MTPSLVLSSLLFLEIPVLLKIWSWSVQRKMMKAVSGASAFLAVITIAGIVFKQTIPNRAYLAFAGMYIFSGLIWAWWKDGNAPDRWNVGEVRLAVLATTMFSSASMALS